MNGKRAVSWLGLPLGAVLGLVACGQQQSGSTRDVLAATTPGTAAPAKAKRLVYALPSDIQTMDPALIYDVETAVVAQHVYRTLVRFSQDGVDIEPDAAEKYDVSPDGLTYTFALRSGMSFNDGTPVDADAVKFSIMRQLDAKHPAHVPGKMRYASFLFGDPATTESLLVKSVEAPTSLTVKIQLARRHVPFLRNLAMGAAAIVSPNAFTNSAPQTTMIGAGPYKLRSYKPDESVVLEKNDQYVGPKPAVDEIRFRILRDANIRVQAIRKGEVDVAGHFDPPALEVVTSDKSLTVLDQPALVLQYLAMNCDRPPLNDPKVRRAVAAAIDRDALVRDLYKNLCVPATGIIPTGMLGHVDTPTSKSDPMAVRRLLAEAGYPDGLDLVMATQDRPRIYNPVGGRLAERVQQDLAKCGIRVKLDVTEFATFLNRMHAKDYTISNTGWVTDNGDPDNFIYELVGREDNNLNYKNPQATKLMRDAAAEPNPDSRAALYRQAEAMVAADAPLIPISYANQVIAVRPRVHNLKLHPTGCTQLWQVSVD